MNAETMDLIDVAFALRGATIPADHGWNLYRLLSERLAWLEQETDAGVHPIRGSDAGSGGLYLGARARLTLRLPRARMVQSYALEGARLALGDGVEVGAARLRPLFAHGALHSAFVATGAEDEAGFQRDVSAELQLAGIGCKVVCGRRRSARASGGEVVGFSLMLYELSSEHSLSMQQTGLGAGRKLGCGIFVPHKSAAAVAS
jgi:CRISPR-associated protein Cas6